MRPLLLATLFLALAPDAGAVNPVVRFTTPIGAFDVELCQEVSAQCAGAAPNTVAHFLATVDAGAYTNSFVHRSAPNFVIQGGAITWDGVSFGNVCPAPCPTIANEYNQSNVRGTVSVPLALGNPDSGTTGWFVNTANNSFLDAQSFTVFGRVIGDGMTVVDAINDAFLLYWDFTNWPDGTPVTPDYECNPDGQGTCTTDPHPYLVLTEITRVPEPGALAAACSAVAVLVGLARRRRALPG
ncbi:MAG: peptidylprolyl isomerase [Polyangiaceae bacterium]|nr:peptidylprolyl isomerase [Polyangiaceae bacterium]